MGTPRELYDITEAACPRSLGVPLNASVFEAGEASRGSTRRCHDDRTRAIVEALGSITLPSVGS